MKCTIIVIFTVSALLGYAPCALAQTLRPMNNVSTIDQMPIFRVPKELFGDPRHFTPVPDTEIGIPSNELPRIRNQRHLRLCQIFCATALVEYLNCKLLGNTMCSGADNIERPSVVSMLMYRDNRDSPNTAAIGPLHGSGNTLLTDIFNKMQSGGLPPLFFSEACFPYEQFIRKPEFSTEERVEKFFFTLRALFEQAKTNSFSNDATTVAKCAACTQLLEISKTYLAPKIELKNIIKALGHRSFNEFLFSIIFEENSETNKDCREVILPAMPNFDYFPKLGDKTSLADLFEAIDRLVTERQPVVLSAVCSARDASDKRCTGHCILITAVKRVRSVATGETVKLFRVHNSWGQDWQSENNDGWLREETLKELTYTADDPNLEKIPKARLLAFAHSLTWVRK